MRVGQSSQRSSVVSLAPTVHSAARSLALSLSHPQGCRLPRLPCARWRGRGMGWGKGGETLRFVLSTARTHPHASCKAHCKRIYRTRFQRALPNSQRIGSIVLETRKRVESTIQKCVFNCLFRVESIVREHFGAPKSALKVHL